MGTPLVELRRLLGSRRDARIVLMYVRCRRQSAVARRLRLCQATVSNVLRNVRSKFPAVDELLRPQRGRMREVEADPDDVAA